MPIYRAQVILPFFSGIPEDVIVNQFHFDATPDDLALVASEIYPALEDFYQTAYGTVATNRVNYVDWARVYCKVFNLSDPTPRIPYVSPFFVFSAGTNASTIPTEVAAVLSFNAEAESGVRFQRLYNRIYLGAMAPGFMTASAADEFPRLSSAFVGQVVTAAQNLLAAGEASGAEWAQVSDATGTLIARPIVGGWMDNSPDTQRRRSVLPTLRNSWLPLP